MGWGAEETALAGLGALFLCGVIASLHPRLALSLASRIALSVGAGCYLAAAIAASSEANVGALPLLWALPLAPVTVAIMLIREMVMTGAGHRIHLVTPPPTAPTSTEIEQRKRRATDPSTPGPELADLAYTEPDLRVSIAANPATPSSVLGWLASSGDDAVLDAIAGRGGPDADANGR